MNNTEKPRNARWAHKSPPTPAIPYPQTVETATAYIHDNGLCIAELARDRQIPRMAFVDLLRGRAKGRRGHTHAAAIVLGLKPVPARGTDQLAA